MKKFVNRIDELEFLNKEYSRNGSSFVVLYGRRRIGKTSLIAEFGKDKNMLYFLATEESESQNRESLKRQVAEYTKNDLLNNVIVDNFDVIFKSLIEYKSEDKKIIVIDEFQYLGKTNIAFPSIFQRIWDTILQKENVMVILCGSLIHMMESQVLAYQSPLYGRRTGQIKLKQINFKHYKEFFENYDRKKLIEFYSVTGGVPKYVELFKENDDIYDSINENILAKQSFLYEEPHFLLQNEVTEVGSYFSIIRSIANGNEKMSKLASDLRLPQTSLTKYLKTLINLDILQREVPITETNPEKSKKGLYKINDNFIKFWFKFIYPNMSYLETNNNEFVLNKIKANFIDNHVSFVYEDVCKEKMWELNMDNKLGFSFDKIGRWWDKSDEIDIVAYNSNDKNIIFGECKYTKNPMDIDVLYDLEKKAKKVVWNNIGRKEKYILFCISGHSDKLKELAAKRSDIILCD